MHSDKKRKLFVKTIIKRAGITNKKVLKAFEEIPREEFVPIDLRDQAYFDHPLPIGEGQTISQPSLVALMTQLLELKGKEKVLEIGTGSGFQAAILSKLAKEVHTIERLVPLSVRAEMVCKKLGLSNIHFHIGDGSLGLLKEKPFDAMIVTAGAKDISRSLIEQLKTGGRLVIPAGEELWNQKLKLVVKTKSGVEIEEIEPVAFVPLIGKEGWKEDD